MLAQIMTALDRGGPGTAIYREAGQQVSYRQLAADVRAFAATTACGGQPGSAWIAARDKYAQVVSVLGCLHGRSAALPGPDGSAAGFDALARVCPPAMIICDDRDAAVARWACQRQIMVRPAGGAAGSGDGRDSIVRSWPEVTVTDGTAVQFFTSGTTGPGKCISLGQPQLAAAVRGVAGRLELTSSDVSLSAAPLNHTLGLLTSVLAGLAAGGSVAFADPLRPRDLLEVVSGRAPTWCAASPSTLRFLHRAVTAAGAGWPGLRLLRSSAAPMPAEARDKIEADLDVQVINAYAMTEAPGEIASTGLGDQAHRGSLGRPTLCEVQVRQADGLDDPDGEVWIRGPNVAVPGAASRPADAGGWWPTGDTGRLHDGYLYLTGRIDDVINSGGLKVWPREIEELILRHPGVAAAVAFPVPHDGLGHKVGLAVVPRPGHGISKAAVRSALMAELTREKWPNMIVVCEEIPRNERGKISRRELWQAFAPNAR